jgi:DNA-binding transcriptional MerR regulator
MAKKALITLKETAEITGLTERTIRYHIKAKNLVPEEDGGKNKSYLFTKAEIRRFLNERKKADKAKEAKKKAAAKAEAKKAKEKAKKAAKKGGK